MYHVYMLQDGQRENRPHTDTTSGAYVACGASETGKKDGDTAINSDSDSMPGHPDTPASVGITIISSTTKVPYEH